MQMILLGRAIGAPILAPAGTRGARAALPARPPGQRAEAIVRKEAFVVVARDLTRVDAVAVWQLQPGPLAAGLAESNELHPGTAYRSSACSRATDGNGAALDTP